MHFLLEQEALLDHEDLIELAKQNGGQIVVPTGALIGLGASMIALQGMTPPEDVFLNLGGMFAIVVAIVPTGRGADFETAVQACRDSGGTLLTHQASKNIDCPGVLALRDAARANVENNMAALLAVGGLALVLAGVFLFKDWTAKRDAEGRKWVLAGFFAAVLVWLGGLIALAASVGWLARNGHYIATIGLLLGILAVAGANAFRLEQRRAKPSGDSPGVMDVLKSAPTNRYAYIAAAMLVVSVVLIVLWAINAITLFWAEISVAFLFVLFWSVQTVDVELEAQRSGSRSGDQPGRLAPAP